MTNPPASLEAAIAALGRKRQGYEDALDAAKDELALLARAIEAAAEGDQPMARNLAKHQAYLESEIRALDRSLADAETHLKFMIDRWNKRKGQP